MTFRCTVSPPMSPNPQTRPPVSTDRTILCLVVSVTFGRTQYAPPYGFYLCNVSTKHLNFRQVIYEFSLQI